MPRKNVGMATMKVNAIRTRSSLCSRRRIRLARSSRDGGWDMDTVHVGSINSIFWTMSLIVKVGALGM